MPFLEACVGFSNVIDEKLCDRELQRSKQLWRILETASHSGTDIDVSA